MKAVAKLQFKAPRWEPGQGKVFLGDVLYEAQPYDRAVLEQVIWTPYGDDPERASVNRRGMNGYIEGVVVEGRTTSRLFHCSSTDAWPVGEKRRFDYCPIDRFLWSDPSSRYNYITVCC